MRRLALGSLLLLAPAPARCAEEGGAFLTLGAGARPAAMGGAYSAVGADADAGAWNPAGLARLEHSGLHISHRESGIGNRYEVLSIARKTARGTLSATGSYLGHDALSGRDELGAPTGSFGAFDISAAAHYGVIPPFLETVALGAGLRYVRSRIAEASAQTFAMDFGAHWRAREPLGPGTPSLGAALRNVGPGLRFLDQSSALPLTASAGLGYSLPGGSLIDIDFIRRAHASLNVFAAGLEVPLAKGFLARLGYNSTAAQTSGGGVSEALSGLTSGFGLGLGPLSVDYAIAPMGELGLAQTLTLGTRF
ncbi:MAG: PorV/PorQ family protein [Elusimicrobia bacterium]|nr:PorV/PorQ family protein [Elusimicrobiota bacterium]